MSEVYDGPDIAGATAYVLGRIGTAAEYAVGVAEQTINYLTREFMMSPQPAALLVADAPDNRFSAAKRIDIE